jgi:hypothetical protein
MGPRMHSWLCGCVRMLIATRILDALTVLIAMGLGLMLRKKWQARIVMVTSVFLALLWCTYHRPPRWLGGVPPILVDLATFGLAYLGGHVALNPPREADRNLKNIYVSSFALLFVIGMIANGWQRTIESNKRDGLQQNETDARNQFSKSLQDVKNSNQAIFNFVSHPPKGFTPEQALSVVRRLVDKQQTQGQSSDATNELRALAMVTPVAENLRAWWDWEGRQQDINNRAWEDMNHYLQQHRGDPQGINQQELKKLEAQQQAAYRDAEDKYGPQALAALIADADWIRRELLKHIPTEKQTKLDSDEISKFAEAIQKHDNTIDKAQMGDYLENLRKRVSVDTLLNGQPN